MRLRLRGLRLLLLTTAALLCAAFVAPCAHAQSFAQPTVVPTGNWPAAIYTADINGDGYPDLIYIDHGATPAASTAHVLLNDGKGHFKQSATIATAGDSIAIGDFLGTGKLSLAWIVVTPSSTCSPGRISYFCSALTIAPANGDGTFAGTQSTFYTNGNLFGTPGTGDPEWHFLTAVKNPGQPRAFVVAEDVTYNSLFSFYTVNGTLAGGYVSYAFPSGFKAGPIAVADLDGDGLLDLAVTDVTGHQALTFKNQLSPYASNYAPYNHPAIAGVNSLALRDVNNDGRPDLIAEGLNGHIDVFPGFGDGGFDTISIGGTGPLDGLTGNGGHLITVADLNHDGQLDALTATPAGISTLLGAGISYLKLGGIYNAGPGHTSYAVADFNGDGNLDLAVDSPEGIAILYGNADGSFQTSRAYAAGQPALSGALAAFTASGKLDAVVSTAATQAQLLRGAGDGTFAAAATPTTTHTGTAGLWSTVQAADLDGDGHIDLLLTADGSNANLPAVGAGTGIYLQRGDGTGNFADPVAATAPVQFNYPASSACTPAFNHFPGEFYGTSVVGDFNGDGLADFASRDDAAYRILRGNNGSASNSYSLAPTLYWSGVDGTGTNVDCNPHAHDLVATAELNQDGHADLIFQGSQWSSGSLLIYLSNTSGGIAPAGDLSVDGSLTTPGQLVAPNINYTFGGTSTTFNQPYFPGAIATADLDRDGNTDILVTYANLSADPTNPNQTTPNYLYIWYGSGGGKFLTSARHPVNPVRVQLSRNYYQVALADLNNDGIPDLILSDGYLVSYQLGVGDGTFGPEHHLLAGAGLNTLATADLRGIGTEDLVVANGGAVLANPVVNHETLAADPVVNTGGITVLLNVFTPRAITSTLTASPEPSVYYSPYSVTATLAGSPAPTGTVTFAENGTQLGQAMLTNGTASVAGALLLPGQYLLTATYSGDANYAAGTLTAGSHTITRSPTTVTLTPTTPLTVYYGQGIDGVFSLGVVDSSHPANGNYTLLDNGVAVAICTNIPYSQQCPYGNPVLLDAGQHVFSIQYLGDAVNAPGTSPNYPYTILPDLTTLTLSSSSIVAYAGQAVTFVAAVTGNITTPTGSVTFTDGGQFTQTRPLVNGNASITVTGLSVGTHTITASYPGTQDFNPAASAPLSEQILPDLTAVTLVSSKNPATLGDAVTFTATVNATYLPPAGAVNFLDGGNVIGTGTLTPLNGVNSTAMSSVATFTTSSLAVGTHPIMAVYAGGPNFNAAMSTVLQQVIQPISLGTQASITTLSSNLNPSAPQQLVTFTATVQVPGVFITVASGTVTFLDGTTTIGSGTLNQFGVATFQTATLVTGTHAITALYGGAVSITQPTILPSNSNVVNQVVTIPIVGAPPGFVMTVTPGSLTVSVGRTGIVAVNILDVSGFNQPVALSCSGLAPETACLFSAATVPAGGGNTTLQLTTNAPRDCNTSTPYGASNAGNPLWPVSSGIAAAVLLVVMRRRRLRLAKGLLMLAAVVGLTALSGCGHCTDLGTKPGSYTFQITAVAQGDPVSETKTATIQLTMTNP